MSYVLTFFAGTLFGTLLGVWFRDVASHSDSSLLGWEWFCE